MLSLVIHRDAGSDVADIKQSDPDAAARIASLIIELQGDQDLLDRLTQHGYGQNRTADFDVSKWISEQNKGRNLWRLKFWELENDGLQYRIIYAFLPREKQYRILAVIPREFAYDDEHDITERIRLAYDEI